MWAVIREMTYRILIPRVRAWSLTRSKEDLVGDLSSIILLAVFLGMLLLNTAMHSVELWFERRALHSNLSFIEARLTSAQDSAKQYLDVVRDTGRASQNLTLENITLKNEMAVVAARNRELVNRNRLLEKELDLSQRENDNKYSLK